MHAVRILYNCRFFFFKQKTAYEMRIRDWSSDVSSSDLPDASSELVALATKHLNREEGRNPHAYQDSLGYWTSGVGRLIDKRKGGRLTNVEIDMLLANDIADRIAEISDWAAWQAVKADPVRATALLSMAFQMGAAGLAGFKNSLKLDGQKRWEGAGANMMR